MRVGGPRRDRAAGHDRTHAPAANRAGHFAGRIGMLLAAFVAVLAFSVCAHAAPLMNQEGVTGIWGNADTSGQGFMFEVYPDYVGQGSGYVFGGWFTYDEPGDESAQRWYSLEGVIDENASSVTLTVYESTGGAFDAAATTQTVAVGTAVFELASCAEASFTYSLDDGRGGTIPLARTLADSSSGCVDQGAPSSPQSDFGFSGIWKDATASTQGMMFEINPTMAYVFGGWFTYSPGGEGVGAAAQRWYTAQSAYTINTREIPLTLYATTGGAFDAATPVPETVEVGEATLTLIDCANATLAYTFTAGEEAGVSGTLELSRAVVAPSTCPPNSIGGGAVGD